METNEENPKLYIITGDRLAGKTTLLDHMLSGKDHLTAHDFSDSMQQVSYYRAFDTQYPEYWKKLEVKEEKELLHYILEQSSGKHDMFIETESNGQKLFEGILRNAHYGLHAKQPNLRYDATIIYCVSDSFEESKKRFLLRYPRYKGKAQELRRLKENYDAMKADIFSRTRDFPCHQQIYTHIYGKQKLIAEMESGKVIKVDPHILTTTWFKEGDKGFRQQVATVLKNQNQQKRLQHNHKQHNNSEKTEQFERRLGLTVRRKGFRM